MPRQSRWSCFTLLLFALGACAQPPQPCPAATGVSLQILGSGGPVADDARASSGYLVWHEGRARILIDAGGGVFLRFGEARADIADLELIAISHFHTDHSADLSALLKSGYFADDRGPIHISGPAGDPPFPGLNDFLQALLAVDSGAYAYLSGYLDGSGGLPLLVPHEIGEQAQPVTIPVGDAANLKVAALRVPHGIVPSVAYRIEVAGKTLVFASDQNGKEPEFTKLAANADVLVMHMPVPVGATGAARALHAPPDVIGSIAQDADVGHLVLSHFMARSLRDLEANVSSVRAHYSGTLTVSNDLDCLLLD